jgi:hypothetical protein
MNQRSRARVFVPVLLVVLALGSYGLFRIEANLVTTQTLDAFDDTFTDVFPCSEHVAPSLANIELFDWAYCSFDLRALWSSMNIVDNRFTDASSLLEAVSSFGDLDRDGKGERILRLTLKSDNDQTIRFVILRPGPSARKWLPGTYLDLPRFHLAPEANVMTNGRESWLVIDPHEQVWDDRIRQENQTWYSLRNGRLIQVLSFPSDVESDWPGDSGAHETVKSRIEFVPSHGSEDRVDVSYDIAIGRNGRSDAVAISRKVSFSRQAGSLYFAFDASHSQISEDIYENIVDVAGHSVTEDRVMDFARKFSTVPTLMKSSQE